MHKPGAGASPNRAATGEAPPAGNGGARGALTSARIALAQARGAPGGRRELIAALARSDTGRAAGLAAAVLAGNVLALVFTIVFARILGAAGYGSLAALLAAMLILSVPGQALQVTVAREVSAEIAAGHPAPAAGVWRWLRRLLLLLVVASATSLLARDLLAGVIGVDQEWAAAATVPTACLWLILSVERGALQALQHYRLVGLSITGEAATRLLFGLLFVAGGLDVAGAFLGTSMSILAMAAVLALPLHRDTGGAHPSHIRRFRDLLGTSWAPLLALALVAVLQNIDVIVVKREAADDPAGSYAAASVAAKAIVWVGIGLALFLVPEAARRARTGEDPRKVLARVLLVIAAAGIPMTAVYAVAAEPLLRAVFGPDLTLAASALPWLGMAMTLLGASYLCVQYLLALHRAAFLVPLAVAALLEPPLLVLAAPGLKAVALTLFGLQAVLAVLVVGLAFRSREARGRPLA